MTDSYPLFYIFYKSVAGLSSTAHIGRAIHLLFTPIYRHSWRDIYCAHRVPTALSRGSASKKDACQLARILPIRAQVCTVGGTGDRPGLPSPLFPFYSEFMALRSNQLTPAHPRRQKKRKRQLTFATIRGFVREGWRMLRAGMRAVLALPPIVRAGVISALLLLLGLGVNWAYQAFHKPTEILFPLDR